MSRKRTPDALKIVAGTARPDRMNPDAPQAASGVSDPPEWLSEGAAERFNQLSAIALDLGIASPVDQCAQALLASRLDEIERLTAIIEDGGHTFLTETGMVRARPEVGMRNEAMRHAQSLLCEFGLTPATRSKVSAAKSQTENPFAMLHR